MSSRRGTRRTNRASQASSKKASKASAAAAAATRGGATASTARLRPVMETIHRIIHDPGLPEACFVFGYLDRFVGILERQVAGANWGDIALLDLKNKREMAVPKHRIQYIKCNGCIVWDKRPESRTDLFWSGRGIHALLDEQLDAGLWDDGPRAPVAAREDPTASAAAASQGQDKWAHKKKSKRAPAAAAGRAGPVQRRPASSLASHPDRPNCFVCVRLTSDAVRTFAHRVQTAIVSSNPILAEACTPLRALHITLATVRCATNDELTKAKAVISDATPALRRALQQYLPVAAAAAPFTIDGLDVFRNRVLFGQPSSGSTAALERLSFAVRDALKAGGVRLMEEGRVFSPHATLVKLSRSLMRRGVDTIDPSLYASVVPALGMAADARVGAAIYLCEMKKPTHDDGFYKVYSQVTPALPPSGGRSASAAAAAAVRPPKLLVIMRGSQGSGKSTLCRRALSLAGVAPENITVVSMDDYWRTQDGRYEWSPQSIPAAAEDQRVRFLAALRAGDANQVIVVDNCHAKMHSYRPFVEMATAAGVPTVVVDLRAPTVAACLEGAARNIHGVPLDAVQRMWTKWEPDAAAVVVDAPCKGDAAAETAARAVRRALSSCSVAAITARPRGVTHAIVLDFEATCRREKPQLSPQEIIEFPSVLVDLRDGSTVSEFQRYVRPVHHPLLTAFCTKLTGIEQRTLDEQGVSFDTALGEWLTWVRAHGQESQLLDGTAVLVTCGDWDLKTMLPAQCAALDPELRVPPCMRRWCNIKTAFRAAFPDLARTARGPRGMEAMLRMLRIPLTGRHHSGIDDCRNTAKIVLRVGPRFLRNDRGDQPATSRAPKLSVRQLSDEGKRLAAAAVHSGSSAQEDSSRPPSPSPSRQSLRQLSAEGRKLFAAGAEASTAENRPAAAAAAAATTTGGAATSADKRQARVLYTGVFLSGATRHRVTTLFPARHERIICDHVTTCFEPSAHDLNAHVLPTLGAAVVLRGGVVLSDKDVQLMAVAPHAAQVWSHPTQRLHATLSLRQGVRAFRSNTLLETVARRRGDAQSSLGPFDCELEGIVGVALKVAPKRRGGRTRVCVVFDRAVLARFDLTCRTTGAPVQANRFAAAAAEPKRGGGGGATRMTSPAAPLTFSQLLVFDFDQTLFHTPDVADYENATRTRWPSGSSWPRSPHSLTGLMAPLVRPGPSYRAFHAHTENLDGKKVVLLTGRPKMMEEAVRDVLIRHGLWSKIHVLLFTPDDYPDSTAAFKARAVATLLREQQGQDHGATALSFWDDDARNHESVAQVLRDTGAVAAPSEVNLWQVDPALDSVELSPWSSSPAGTTAPGGMPGATTLTGGLERLLLDSGVGLFTDAFSTAAKLALGDVAAAWSSILCRRGIPVTPADVSQRFAVPFGSFAFGRKSDIDLALFAPPQEAMPQRTFMKELSTALRVQRHASRGVFVASADWDADSANSRVVVVRALWTCDDEGPALPPIELDILFSPLSRGAWQRVCQATTPEGAMFRLQSATDDVPADYADKRQAAAALQGLMDTQGLLRSVDGLRCAAGTPRDRFAAAIGGLLLLLEAAGLRGSHFLAVRSFMLVHAAARFFTEDCPGGSSLLPGGSAAHALAALVHGLATADDRYWRRLVRGQGWRSATADNPVESRWCSAGAVAGTRAVLRRVDAALQSACDGFRRRGGGVDTTPEGEEASLVDVVRGQVQALSRESRARFPPTGALLVTLRPRVGVDRFVFEAKVGAALPAVTQRARAEGLVLVPGPRGTSSTAVTFAVPRGACVKDALREWLRELSDAVAHVHVAKAGDARYVGVPWREAVACFSAAAAAAAAAARRTDDATSAAEGLGSLMLPCKLSREERESVHALAEAAGLGHHSAGRGRFRHVVLCWP